MILLLLSLSLVFFIYALSNQLFVQRYFPFIVTFFILNCFAFFLVFLFSSFYLVRTNLEWYIVRKTVINCVLIAVLTSYIALILERRFFTSLVQIVTLSQLSLFPFLSSADFNSITTLFYIVVIPIIEEFAKIFPLFILINNFARFPLASKTVRVRLIPSHRLFVFYGAFFGLWFDLYEQFLILSNLYSSNVVSILAILDLLFERSIFPLHSSVCMITGFGLGYIFVNRNNFGKKKKSLIFFSFLLLSSIIHGFWNYHAVNSSAPPIIATIIKILSWIIFIGFCLFILTSRPKICKNCFTEHNGTVCHRFKPKTDRISEKKQIIADNYDLTDTYIFCPKCKSQTFNGQYCSLCWSFPKILCENCDQVLPPFSRVCWTCGQQTLTLFEKLKLSSYPLHIVFSIGLTRLLTASLVVSFVLIFKELENTIVFLGNTIFFLSIFIAFTFTTFWYMLESGKVNSAIISVCIASSAIFAIIGTSSYLLPFSILQILSGQYFVFGLFNFLIITFTLIFAIAFLLRVLKGGYLVIL